MGMDGLRLMDGWMYWLIDGDGLIDGWIDC